MRTRFPPSPTGFVHMGSLRTALYCYLMAKKTNGTFILRIEDTDQERLVEGAVENLVKTLHWAGLDPDEGVMLSAGKIIQKGDKAPYIQSHRLEIYKEHAGQLIKSGHAYYAFDTKEEIEQMRTDLQKAGVTSPQYDSSTRLRMKNSLSLPETEVKLRLKKGDPYVIRLLVPESEIISIKDIIRGKVEFKSHTVDDTVLLKSDGYPTYHLANVVDDHLMEVDTVIRGEEWLPSLPKHILLYRAFSWEPPQFAHVPLLLNKDKTKLSKRQNDVSVEDYINQGYLKEALLNFLALLGWNPGTPQEIFSLEELIEQFSLERIQKAGAVFDRGKLDWLQGQWMRKIPLSDFADKIKPLVTEKYPESKDEPDFEKKAALIQERITFDNEAPGMLSFFYEEPKTDWDLLISEKQKVTAENLPGIITLLIETLSNIDDSRWNEEHLKDVLFKLTESKGYKTGQILWPLRAALTGLQFSPGAFEVAAILGKEESLKRLERCKI